MTSKPPVDPLDQLDPAAAAATRWFVALHEEPGDDSMQAEFVRWRDADPAHAAAYTRLQRLWGASGHLPSLQVRRTSIERRTLIRSAATVTLGAAAMLVTGRIALGPHPLADYATGTGERRTVALTDGSRVELSTRTALAVEFDERRRHIHLLDGEAWFQVARDPGGRPFTVEAAGGVTTALGTAFAVAHADGGARVTVTEHAVDVAASGTVRHLMAGQACAYTGAAIAPAQGADPTTLSWREGQLAFISRPLGEVVSALDRWKSGETFILDRDLAHHPVTLVIAIGDVGDALRRLGASLPMRIIEITPLLTLVRAAP
jgi:transmembrane sensor